MTEFEKRLLETLDTLALEAQNQSKAIAQLQTAVGELSDDIQRLFTRFGEEARKNHREHTEHERRLDVLENARPTSGNQEATG